MRSGPRLPTARSANGPRTLRLFIGDADGVFRRTLRDGLAAEPGVDVVGESDDGADALRLIRWARPDVALLDEDLPSFGGAAISRILRHELPETRVVVLTRAASTAVR